MIFTVASYPNHSVLLWLKIKAKILQNQSNTLTLMLSSSCKRVTRTTLIKGAN